MKAIPATPLILGLAGLVPFWALAIALLTPIGAGFDHVFVDRALATYAAVILSFLGGIRWGLVSRESAQNDVHFGLSVLPSLVAWALLAAPEPWRLAGLGFIAVASGPIDAHMVSQDLAPSWLGRLRVILSTGAGAALLLGAVGSIHA